MDDQRVDEEVVVGGGGDEGNACPKTPRFWKTSLNISRFGSFVN